MESAVVFIPPLFEIFIKQGNLCIQTEFCIRIIDGKKDVQFCCCWISIFLYAKNAFLFRDQVCNFTTMGTFLFVLVMEYLSFYAMCPLFKTLLFRYNFDLFYEKIQVQCMYIVSKLMNKLTFLFFCSVYITS